MRQWSRIGAERTHYSQYARRIRTTPNPVISGPYTISGVVAESGRSNAGANVNAFVNQGTFAYSYM
jgi:hypothetical protein